MDKKKGQEEMKLIAEGYIWTANNCFSVQNGKSRHPHVFCHFFRRPVPVEFVIAFQSPVTEPKPVVASEPKIRLG